MFPLFAASVIDTGGKFAVGIKNTSGIDGKFAVGIVDSSGKFSTCVIDTCRAPWLANISAKFLKKLKWP